MFRFPFVGDTADAEYPLFRDGRAPDSFLTMASALFLPRNAARPGPGVMRVWTSNPKLFPLAYLEVLLPF